MHAAASPPPLPPPGPTAGAPPPQQLHLAHPRPRHVDHDAVEGGHSGRHCTTSPLPSPSKKLRRPNYLHGLADFCPAQHGHAQCRRIVAIVVCALSAALVLSSALVLLVLPAVAGTGGGSGIGSGGNSHRRHTRLQHRHRHRSLSEILSRRFAAEIDERTGGANIIQAQTQADDDDDRIGGKMSAQTQTPPSPSAVVFATRIHLGHARAPPASEDLRGTVASFLSWAASCGARRAAIAVDPAPKIEGYDLVRAVEEARDAYYLEGGGLEGGGTADDDDDDNPHHNNPHHNHNGPLVCDVVPVAPWGRFVPALNALVSWAATAPVPDGGASRIMFASAETSVTPSSVQILLDHVDDDHTLVAGCALPGHDYREGGGEVPLTGRTTPWNTCAVWNLRKLATTGFPLVAEGLHAQEDGTPGPGGVEEASTIAILQRTLPRGTAVAKLVKVPGVKWEVDWDDEERRRWHESKMRSKVERAAVHLKTLGLEGTVLHV